MNSTSVESARQKLKVTSSHDVARGGRGKFVYESSHSYFSRSGLVVVAAPAAVNRNRRNVETREE